MTLYGHCLLYLFLSSFTAFLEMWNSYEVSRIPMNVIDLVSLCCFYLGALYYIRLYLYELRLYVLRT